MKSLSRSLLASAVLAALAACALGPLQADRAWAQADGALKTMR